MASRFPVQINNLRFFVNPTNISITKNVNYTPIVTQNGVRYQVWYDSPEVMTIRGASAGDTAYRELLFLKQNFERQNKISELFYKTRVYRGFITELTIDTSTDTLGFFNYAITFQLLQGERFGVEDLSVRGTDDGLVGSSLRRAENFVNEKLNVVETSISRLLSKF